MLLMLLWFGILHATGPFPLSQAESFVWEIRRAPGISFLPRQNHIAASVKGKVFVGLGRNDETYLRDWWMYDPETDTWKPLAPFPGLPREFPFVFVLQNRIYVGGGRGASGRPFADVYSYDPDHDEWTPVASLPQPRWGAPGASDGTYGYVLSGSLGGGYPSYSDELLRYDPAENRWAVISRSPLGPRWIPFMVYWNGALYAGGGVGENGACGNMFVRFLIRENRWEVLAPPPAPLYDGWAVVAGGKIFVLGAHVHCPPNRCTDRFFVFDPSTHSWNVLPPFPGGNRNNLIGAAVGDVLYAGMGNGCRLYVVDWWKLSPQR